jgi:hypothetical protein
MNVRVVKEYNANMFRQFALCRLFQRFPTLSQCPCPGSPSNLGPNFVYGLRPIESFLRLPVFHQSGSLLAVNAFEGGLSADV